MTHPEFRPESDRVDEYLAGLQDQLDQALRRNRRLEARIEKLEHDRVVLREKLEAERGRRVLRRAAPPRRGPVSPDPGPASGSGTGPIPPCSLPPEHPRLDMRVATILDPFSRAAFGYEFSCIDLEPETWVDQLELADPDLLLVESVFSGRSDRWPAQVARFGAPSETLTSIVDWFRKHGKPTVFWNKEDPINYDWFIASASLFDHVFTVDGDTIERYRADLGHDRVGLLQFAAQPHIHYPPEDDSLRTGYVAFAGSYYARKHPERRAQMEYVIAPARDFGLDIFDRAPGSDQRFAWPEEYRSHIVGSLDYAQTLEAYRRYRVFLNINTVTKSPTMFARRVFDLLATGMVVVSGPSRALETMLPTGIVGLTSDAATTRNLLDRLRRDEHEWRERSEAGIAWITAGRHTMVDRVATLLDAIS